MNPPAMINSGNTTIVIQSLPGQVKANTQLTRQAPGFGCLPCSKRYCTEVNRHGSKMFDPFTPAAISAGKIYYVGSTVRHVIRNRPVNRISVERVRLHVGEVRTAARGALERTVQERHALAAGAGRIRGKRRRGHAVRDAVLDCPGNRLGIVSAHRNIREAACGLRLGAAGGAPQEGDDLRTGAGLVGAKHRVGQAVRHVLIDCPLHCVGEVSVRGNISKAGSSSLNELRLDADLAIRHDKAVLAVAEVGERKQIAARILDGEAAELIALVGLHRDGHIRALGGVGRGNGHRAVGDSGSGRGIGRRAGNVRIARVLVADRAGRAGLVHPVALGVANRADAVLVGPVVAEFLQRLRHNGGCLRTSLVLEDSTASGAGVVLVVAVFRAGRGLGIGLGQSGVLLTCLRAERLIIGVQNTRLGGCGMDVAGCLIIRESICALRGKRC